MAVKDSSEPLPKPKESSPYVYAPLKIMQNTALGPAAKLCYFYLWTLAGGRPSEVHTSYTSLGAAMGKSPRSAMDWIGLLVGFGLVEICPVIEPGELRLYVLAPASLRVVRRDRLSPQLELPFAALPAVEPDSGTSANVLPFAQGPGVSAGVSAQEPPRYTKEELALAAEIDSRKSKDPEPVTPKPIVDNLAGRSGVSARKAPSADLDLTLTLHNHAHKDIDLDLSIEQEGEANDGREARLVARLIKLVSPKLAPTPARRIVAACLEGWLNWEHVKRAGGNIEAGIANWQDRPGRPPTTIDERRAIYFIGAMKRKFQELGHAWPARGP